MQAEKKFEAAFKELNINAIATRSKVRFWEILQLQVAVGHYIFFFTFWAIETLIQSVFNRSYIYWFGISTKSSILTWATSTKCETIS